MTTLKSGKRKINKSYRYDNSAKAVTYNGEKLYCIGKDQKKLLGLLPKKRSFTLREVRIVGIENLDMTKYRIDHVLNGLVGRNYVVPQRGRTFTRGHGIKAS